MKNLWLLVKVNLKSFFVNKSSKKKSNSFIILFAYAIIFFYTYIFCNKLIEGFIAIKTPEILLVLVFSAISLMLLFTNIFKIDGTLFKYKDYDLLMSLPIDKKMVILSKIITLYLSNLILVLAFMIPAYVVYITHIDVSILFHIIYMFTLLIIPLVPIIIATIIGSFITILTSKIKNKNVMQILISLLFFVLVMSLSMKSENASMIDMANIGTSIINQFNSYYPLVNIYRNIIINYDLISLLIFVFIPCVLFAIYLLIMNKFYNRINSNLMSISVKKAKAKYQNNQRSPLMAIYKKELKRLFSSANYFMNTAIGAIMLILFVGYLLIFGMDKINVIFEMEDSTKLLSMIPMVLCIFASINCTTNCSISLEGNNMWIIKSLPVKPMTIFIAKILVNLTMIVPVTIMSGIILGIVMKVSFVTLIFMVILPVIYAIFISMLGLLLNLIYPDLNWTNEIKPIKQSLPTFLTMMIGFALSIAPLFIEVKFNMDLYMLIIFAGISILSIIVYSMLRTVGIKKFKNI